MMPTTMSHKINQQIIIPETHIDLRLDQALAQLLPEYSRTQIQNWIESGAILVDGQKVKGKVKTKGNELVTLEAEQKEEPTWEAQPIKLSIVHEDDALIIINKPVGLVVHPGAGNSNNTLLNALIYHAPALKLLPRAGILHRIDKDTSGLLVIAKTPAALRLLSEQLKDHTIEREYQAIVYGAMISGGTVDAAIDRHPLDRKRMAISEVGRHAVTHYRVGERFRAHTLLKLKLETGRTHQIRVHMSHIKHPIVGDPTYGGKAKVTKGMTAELMDMIRRFKRQALHAFRLSFTHPLTHELVSYEIDLPDDMKVLLEAMRVDTKQFKK